jgi:hypothetical protein
LGGS